MSVHHLRLRTDHGTQAEVIWDASDPEIVALSVHERGLWTASELRELAYTLRTVADALESDSDEWRSEMMRDAGFVERRTGRSAVA